MTKDELKAAVDSYLHRTTDTADFDLFLLQAEADIVQQVRAFEMEAQYTLDEADRIVGGGYNLPDGFIEMRYVIFGRYEVRPVASMEGIQFRAGSGGDPIVYYLAGDLISLQPAPATDSQISLDYFAKPAALAAGSDTNTLITNHPSLYIYSCAMYAYDWERDYEQREAASNRFVAKLEEINTIDERRRYGPSVSVGNNQDFGAWGASNGGM